ALCSTISQCHACTSASCHAGTRATRCAFVLISFGTPMSMSLTRGNRICSGCRAEPQYHLPLRVEVLRYGRHVIEGHGIHAGHQLVQSHEWLVVQCKPRQPMQSRTARLE